MIRDDVDPDGPESGAYVDGLIRVGPRARMVAGALGKVGLSAAAAEYLVDCLLYGLRDVPVDPEISGRIVVAEVSPEQRAQAIRLLDRIDRHALRAADLCHRDDPEDAGEELAFLRHTVEDLRLALAIAWPEFDPTGGEGAATRSPAEGESA